MRKQKMESASEKQSIVKKAWAKPALINLDHGASDIEAGMPSFLNDSTISSTS